MKKTVKSSDQTSIAYEVSGSGETALIFSHGWLGNKRWWDAQRDHLKDQYTIAQLDLGGHGESGKERIEWSAQQYADDIVAVAQEFSDKKIILVGHSMSGVYVTMAALKIPQVKGIILVDTLKNLDQMFTISQAGQMLDSYRVDFPAVVENVLPQYLFASTTPTDVRARVQKEFVSHSGDFAATALAPLYKTDVREDARKIQVPVRAINSDIGGTSTEVNSKYYKDFDFRIIKGVGHYPMLENPVAFNHAMDEVLKDF